MQNKYVNFISDEHLLSCIKNLHDSYQRAKAQITKKKFYNNKVDTIKLTFDSKFNELDEEEIIEAEILRQIDKSINNSIGTFHEEVLGGVEGYELGQLSGFDIKAKNDTLFADIKNKHNTMNSSAAESLFQKLAHFADTYKQAKCYWVQILAKGSFEEKWMAIINGKEYSHSRVYKISGDKFYELITGEKNAFYNLYKSLPQAIDDFKSSLKTADELEKNTALSELKNKCEKSNRSLFDQITFDNYGYYSGFNDL